jgi:hypothetical protein
MGPDALAAFFKARATSALAYALSSEPDAFLESVYEAINASSDESGTIKAVETALAAEN